MKKKIRSLIFMACIVAVIAVGAVFGNGFSARAADSTPDDLVIVEVQDTETPAANIQAVEEGPSYFGLAVCLAAAAAALLVAFLVLERRYGQLKQETRRLEDEIARLYSANSDV